MARHWVLKLSKKEKETLVKSIIKLRVEEQLDVKTIAERKQLSSPYILKILRENNINTKRIRRI